LASGPSLTIEDVEKVRNWRTETGGVVIVANTTFRIAPWADVVYAMDSRWWKVHYQEVRSTFSGRRLSTSPPSGMDVEKTRTPSFRNSGAGCIAIAASLGATTIVLLGYDCMKDGERTHWHGSHPAGMSDAKTIALWPVLFSTVSNDMKRRGITVLNASRRTALKCFETIALEDAIQGPASSVPDTQ
jgi:hypothetical protein